MVASPARAAYEAYRASSDGKSLVSGDTLPEFDELSEAIRAAWTKAADAARQAPAAEETGPDGRRVIKLRKPIQLGKDSEAITELRFRKPKGRDMRLLPDEGRNFGHSLDILGKMCGQSPAVMDELSEEDLQEVGSLLAGF